MTAADIQPDSNGRSHSLPIEVSAITAILALVLAVLAGAGAALYQRSATASYQSYSVLLIDQPTAVASVDSDSVLVKLQRLRYFYAGLLRTDVIAGPVARQLNVPTALVEAHLSALIDPTSFTLDIVARAAAPASSNLLAQSATSELIHYVNHQQATENPPIQPIARVVLSEVTTPQAGIKVAPGTTKIVASGAIGFVVVGAAFIIVADLLRRRR